MPVCGGKVEMGELDEADQNPQVSLPGLIKTCRCLSTFSQSYSMHLYAGTGWRIADHTI
jgi:hypothetical protein